MQFHLSDYLNAGTLLVVFGIYRKVSIVTFQHTLMWTDFSRRKGLIGPPEGADAIRSRGASV